MYFHGYRSYQKKRLKNKYGKYLMGMLVVTALVTFFVQRQENPDAEFDVSMETEIQSFKR